MVPNESKSDLHRLTAEEWKKSWQDHWAQSQLNYEIPEQNIPITADREFLTQIRTPEKEK